jgi:hypothetical protein
MRKLVLVALLCFASLQAQNISGNWQGTLGEGTDDKIRLLVRIAKVHNAWAATLISIDQGGDWGADQPLTSITLKGATFKFKVDAPDHGDFGAFEGTVNPSGASIQGSWIQGGYRQPLTFNRATAKTAWKDQSPHSIQFVTVDAGVKLEVLDWGGRGLMLLLAGNGTPPRLRRFGGQTRRDVSRLRADSSRIRSHRHAPQDMRPTASQTTC